MKVAKKIFVILLLNLVYNHPAFALEMPSHPFTYYSPNLAHILNGSSALKGLSMAYKYHGFISPVGQVDFSYTSESENSYTLGIGIPYMIFEGNIKLTNYNNYKLFLNVNIGILINERTNPIFKNIGYLGSLGTSFSLPINNQENFDLILDTFYHQGWSNEILHIPYLRGVTFSTNYANNFIGGFWFSLYLGLSYTEHRLLTETSPIGSIDKYYITRKSEKNWVRQEGYNLNFKWKPKFVVPISISVLYKF
jgi:hypothetical protein